MNRSLALGGVAAVALTAGRAGASPCGTNDLLVAIPIDGASGVPLDADLTAHYPATAIYTGEDVEIVPDGGEAIVLSATFDENEGLLRARPGAILRPGAGYTVRWPGLRGKVTADRGAGAAIHFTSGLGPDVEAPRFGPLLSIAWDLTRDKSSCTDSIQARYAFDLTIPEAADDGGLGALTLVVFQTRGPLIDGGPVPVLTRPMPEANSTVRIELAVDRGIGVVCFAGLARDSTGKVSGALDELCVTTVEPPFFRGCALAAGTQAPAPGAAALGLMALIVRRVRRRAARRRSHA